MTTNELRLGNYVGSNIGLAKIKSIEKDRVIITEPNDDRYSLSRMIDEIKPISIDYERLIDLGFSDKDYKQGWIGIDVLNTDFVLAKPENESASHKGFYRWVYEQAGVYLLKKIQFVHELQNLVYELTGVELSIKPCA